MPFHCPPPSFSEYVMEIIGPVLKQVTHEWTQVWFNSSSSVIILFNTNIWEAKKACIFLVTSWLGAHRPKWFLLWVSLNNDRRGRLTWTCTHKMTIIPQELHLKQVTRVNLPQDFEQTDPGTLSSHIRHPAHLLISLRSTFENRTDVGIS